MDVRPVGARFGGRARPSRRTRREIAARTAVDAAADDSTTIPLPVPSAPADRDTSPDTSAVERSPTVAGRPYVLTGGRTRTRQDLRVETLVTTVGPRGDESEERGRVLDLCVRPRSVGEVASLTRVPLGVARVLVGDLAGEGRLRVHGVVDAATGPDLALLDRVLDGLRRL